MKKQEPDPRPVDAGNVKTGGAMDAVLSAKPDSGHPFSPQDLFVAPQGKDHWSGRLPEPNAAGTDSPLVTVERSRNLIRERKGLGVAVPHHPVVYQDLVLPMTVWLRGGEYRLTKPLEFDERDSGPVRYRAYPGETPLFSGSRQITGWRDAEVNGRQAWIADVPEVSRGGWNFRQIFVNGEMRLRASPNGASSAENLYRMEDVPGIDRTNLQQPVHEFICKDGDIRQWRNLSDVEIVIIHYWIEERTPIRSFDPAANRVELQRKTCFFLMDSGKDRRFAPYYVENVFEALTDPGEWYLDRSEGRLYYIPKSLF